MSAVRRSHVARHPVAFALGVLRAFRANQGLLLAGSVAYYTLLSLIPLLILVLIALSAVVPREALLATLGRYLSWLIPAHSAAVLADLARFLDHRESVGWVLFATMLVASSLGFAVLENAMAILFAHRAPLRRRRFLVSTIIPYCFILFLGSGLLLMTLVSGAIETIGGDSVSWLGHSFSLHGLSGVLLYLLGVAGEVLVLASIYFVLPVGTPSWRHALLGAVTATALWEITRRLLVWYFATLSPAGTVYGALATAIAVLVSLDFAATFLLLGAQVVAEYERIGAPGGQASR